VIVKFFQQQGGTDMTIVSYGLRLAWKLVAHGDLHFFFVSYSYSFVLRQGIENEHEFPVRDKLPCKAEAV